MIVIVPLPDSPVPTQRDRRRSAAPAAVVTISRQGPPRELSIFRIFGAVGGVLAEVDMKTTLVRGEMLAVIVALEVAESVPLVRSLAPRPVAEYLGVWPRSGGPCIVSGPGESGIYCRPC